MTLSDACKQYLLYCKNTKKLSPLSVNAYYHDLESFQKATGVKLDIADIDRNSIYAFIDVLFEHGRSKTTVKRRIACLKTFFKWLENEELIEISPFLRFDLKLRLPQRLPRNLNVDELKKMHVTASSYLGFGEGNEYSPELIKEKADSASINDFNSLIIVELLFCTGVRVSELVSIKLDDISLATETVKIHGKGQRERKVFISEQTISNLISGYVQRRNDFTTDHDNFLINSRGRPLSAQSARLLVKKCAKNASLPRVITPHMYRHTAATQLLEAGLDMRFVQKLLGHESIETTQIYTHVEDLALKENVMKAGVRGRFL